MTVMENLIEAPTKVAGLDKQEAIKQANVWKRYSLQTKQTLGRYVVYNYQVVSNNVSPFGLVTLYDEARCIAIWRTNGGSLTRILGLKLLASSRAKRHRVTQVVVTLRELTSPRSCEATFFTLEVTSWNF